MSRGGKTPTGRKKQETGLARAVQHHNRPEYAEQTRIQSTIIMSQTPGSGPANRKEAKRAAKAIIKNK